MGIDDHTYELIDQYLQGELQDDHPFVQRLKEDEQLAQEVELRRLADVAILNYRLMDVDKLLDSRRSKFVDQNSGKWKWAIGSLALIILGAAVYFYSASSKQETIINNTETTRKNNNSIVKFTDSSEAIQETIHSPKLEKAVKKEEKRTEKAESTTIVSDNKEATPLIETEQKHAAVTAAFEQPKELVTQKQTAIVTVNPCTGVHLKAFVDEERPCRGTSEGQLTIKNTRGGKAPYQFSLDGKHFQEENKFVGLKANEYDVMVKDANNCETAVYEKYPLISKNCNSYSEHIFNPNVNSWEVPNNQDKQGELTILDENGLMVYSRTFDKGEKINWGGIGSSGTMLVPGVYIYTIKYSDGVVDQGKITITY